MAKAGTFNRNHGANVVLLEDDTVAHRVRNLQADAIVFSAQAVPLGGTFQVKLLDVDRRWSGPFGIVSQREARGIGVI